MRFERYFEILKKKAPQPMISISGECHANINSASFGLLNFELI